MTETTGKVKKSRKIVEDNSSKVENIDTEIKNQVNNDYYIYNFKNIEEVASRIYSSIADRLLNGNLVFAYKGVSQNSDLNCLVVVQYNGPDCNMFGAGVFKKSYSYCIPFAPIEYLDEVKDELIEAKVDKKIIATFTSIIEDLEKRVNKNNNNN